jgi:hypothetical protein
MTTEGARPARAKKTIANDYFVDVAPGCALESAPAHDSLEYSSFFKGRHRESIGR